MFYTAVRFLNHHLFAEIEYFSYLKMIEFDLIFYIQKAADPHDRY